MKIDPISRYMLHRVGNIKEDRNRGPVLLMYHAITTGNQKVSSKYSVSLTQFTEQLDLLKQMDWKTQRVCDLGDARNLTRRTAVLTFDDGYMDNYERAYLELRKRAMRGTWFAVTGYIGSQAHWLGITGDETKLMSTEQLREMARNGMEIGSHTLTHPDLTTLGQSDLDREIVKSRFELEDFLGQPVRSFAYPYGRLNQRIISTVRRAGYSYACTTRPGWFHSHKDPLRLRRVTVFSGDTLGDFSRKLVFADNDVSWGKMRSYFWRRMIARLGFVCKENYG